jgi:hypothetical protein
MFHELLSRDRGDGCDTGQPQGVGSEAYLNSTSQGPTPEDARKDGQIHGPHSAPQNDEFEGFFRGLLVRFRCLLQAAS